MRPTRRPDPVRLIVSGGPGSGKTALINALTLGGETCCPEVSRDLIREQRIGGGRALPWLDLEAFACECSRRMLAQLANCGVAPRIFFDRGLPDLIGYLRCAGRDVPESLLASAAHYTRLVFWAPPWREIYVNDAERPQNYSEAAALGEHIRAAYDELGFEVVDLARESVDARVEQVRAYL
jgi:predicted ATPase